MSPLRTGLNLFASLALTFLGLLLVTFIIGRVVPIDPVLAIVGDRAPGHVVERVREELGLNRPLYEQFAIYVWDVLQGDLGTSVLTANPVIEDIKRVFPSTLELAPVATPFGVRPLRAQGSEESGEREGGVVAWRTGGVE